MLNIYRCRICGETIICDGETINCPWCGALKRHIIHPNEWDFPEFEITSIELSEKTYQHFIRARDLEVDNANFYKCVSKKTRNREIYSLFRALSKIEFEHAKLLSKTMGVELPKLTQVECSDNEYENLSEA
ncbi:MAG: ferritin family protein, partial [Candidatus Odinarchaeia archaeon]